MAEHDEVYLRPMIGSVPGEWENKRLRLMNLRILAEAVADRLGALEAIRELSDLEAEEQLTSGTMTSGQLKLTNKLSDYLNKTLNQL